ncbi:MAG: LytTR family DNA-binding domain-containing protein [Saprospiraceae bacterium]
MRSIIVDDELMSRAHLVQLCKRIDTLEVVGVFEDALTARQFLAKHPVDLVLLDVEMPDFSGLDLVAQLKSNNTMVVFVSSKETYALEAFEYLENVKDYLLKPVTLPRLLKAIERVEGLRNTPLQSSDKAPESVSTMVAAGDIAQEKHLFVKTDRKLVRIDLDELLYVETIGDYAIFKTEKGQFTVHTTLKSVSERLEGNHFVKVHRSFIVNVHKIKDIEDNNLLINDKVIPISRNHRNFLMERIMPL